MLTPNLEVLHVTETMVDIENVFKTMVVGSKRNQQVTIGASELGIECEKCLARKLAKIPPTSKRFNYAPWQGTACHLWLEKNFKKYDQQRFQTEKKVKITRIKNHGTIYGNIDLYDTENAMSIDWKFLGESSLKKHSTNMSQQYEIQAQLYGYGLHQNNLPCDYVAVCMLPRTTSKWGDRRWWWAKYDEDKALWAINRAETMMKKITQYKQSDNLQDFIDGLKTKTGCFTCQNYEN